MTGRELEDDRAGRTLKVRSSRLTSMVITGQIGNSRATSVVITGQTGSSGTTSMFVSGQTTVGELLRPPDLIPLDLDALHSKLLTLTSVVGPPNWKPVSNA